jgi:HK97 family phage prohead protease
MGTLDGLTLAMELRDVDAGARTIVGCVAPYDEVSYMTPDPSGERIRRGAFARSIQHRGAKVPLLRSHDREVRYGVSRSFAEDAAGLLGEFVVNHGDQGDQLLEECRDGYLAAMSAGWLPLDARRGADGVREITEAKLVEVSLVAVPAYEGATMLAMRSASDLDAMLAPFRARPDVNLAPVPPIVYRPRRT